MADSNQKFIQDTYCPDDLTSKNANFSKTDASKRSRSVSIKSQSVSRQSVSIMGGPKMPIILVDTPSLPNFIEETSSLEYETIPSQTGRLSAMQVEKEIDEVVQTKETVKTSSRHKLRSERIATNKLTLKEAANKLATHKNAIDAVRDWMMIDETPEQAFVKKQLKELRIGSQPMIEAAMAEECIKILENTHNHYMRLYNIMHPLCQVTHQRIIMLKKRLNYFTISAKNNLGRLFKIFQVDKIATRETHMSQFSRKDFIINEFNDSNETLIDGLNNSSSITSKSKVSQISTSQMGRHNSFIGKNFKPKSRKQSMFSASMAKVARDYNEDKKDFF